MTTYDPSKPLPDEERLLGALARLGTTLDRATYAERFNDLGIAEARLRELADGGLASAMEVRLVLLGEETEPKNVTVRETASEHGRVVVVSTEPAPEAAKKPLWKVGDVVTLCSGGPRMTVVGLDEKKGCFCAFFDGARVTTTSFPHEALQGEVTEIMNADGRKRGRLMAQMLRERGHTAQSSKVVEADERGDFKDP